MNVVITGGASGLGKSISETLLKDSGNRLLVTYRTPSETVEQWKANAQLTLVQCDFADDNSINNLLQQIEAFAPEALINNANSGYREEYFHKTEDAIVEQSFSVNVLATIKITRKCISLFRKKKSGRIINILSSVLAGNPPVGWSVYTAEKAYLAALNKSWATENAAFKITSNAISPEFMQTSMTSGTDERIVEQMVGSHPLKKLLSTEEVAEAVEFFLHCSPHINGTHLIINSAKNVI